MSAQRSAYHLLAKPAGAACNLGCQYCFFLSKENLYPARESPLMPDDILEAYIKQLMRIVVRAADRGRLAGRRADAARARFF